MTVALDTPAFQPYLTTSHGLLLQGDCVELLKLLRNESVDTVFADPPFNLNKKYPKGVSDRLKEEEYLAWTAKWLDECVRVLRPGGSLFVYNLPKWNIHIGAYLMPQLQFRHWIAVSMKNTFARGNMLYPAHYGLLYFSKGDPTYFERPRIPVPVCRHCNKDLKDYGGYRSKLHEDGINLSDFWDDTSPVRHRGKKVRTANELKPMIPERAILMSTPPNGVVLDPFGGGGSTYQAAEKLHRSWIGFEIGDCEPIQTRMRESFPDSHGLQPPLTVVEAFTDEHQRSLFDPRS